MHLTTLNCNNGPLPVCLYLQQIRDPRVASSIADDEQPPAAGQLKGLSLFRGTEDEATRAAMIVTDEEAPPQPDQLKGLAFFGDTAEEAEQQALAYLGVT